MSKPKKKKKISEVLVEDKKEKTISEKELEEYDDCGSSYYEEPAYGCGGY